jgi:tetratricopeptide (TPR) repeat protein
LNLDLRQNLLGPIAPAAPASDINQKPAKSVSRPTSVDDAQASPETKSRARTSGRASGLKKESDFDMLYSDVSLPNVQNRKPVSKAKVKLIKPAVEEAEAVRPKPNRQVATKFVRPTKAKVRASAGKSELESELNDSGGIIDDSLDSENISSGGSSGPSDDKIPIATDLLAKKQFAQVIDLLRPVSDRLGRNGLLILARAQGAKGDHLSRIRTIELCLAKNAKDALVHKELGDAYSEIRKFDESIASYREAVSLNKDFPAAYLGLATTYEKSKSLDDARETYHRLIKRFGETPIYLTSLCRLFLADGFLADAVATCKKASEQDSEDASNSVNLAKAFLDKEEPEKAGQVLRQASSRFPASEPVQSMAGQASFGKGDHVSAHRHYTLAAVADPKSIAAQIGLAQSAFELQKYQEALTAYERACKLDRGRASIEFRKSMFKLKDRQDYKWQGRFENSIDDCYR